MELEHLSEQPAPIESHEGTGEGREGEVVVGAQLVADDEAAEAGGPGEGVLNMR